MIGTVESGPHGAYLDAGFIFAGSRAAYLDTWAKTRMPTPLIIGMGIIGLGICAYGLVPAFRRG
ncbi:MAG: hypothetical protein H0T53_04385 [Herpetosiphonaceae bacterium]|nr:hypothetical protein [Herpetosiphonaceae bacterium]